MINCLLVYFVMVDCVTADWVTVHHVTVAFAKFLNESLDGSRATGKQRPKKIMLKANFQ